MCNVRLQAAAAYMALGFGSFLAIAETVRNWGNWQWWPFWLVDYIAATLLLCAAIATLRRAAAGPALLAGSWGFTTAMFYMSFWSHIAEYDQPAEGNIEKAPLTVIIGLLWAVTIVGFVLSLLSAGASSPVGRVRTR